MVSCPITNKKKCTHFMSRAYFQWAVLWEVCGKVANTVWKAKFCWFCLFAKEKESPWLLQNSFLWGSYSTYRRYIRKPFHCTTKQIDQCQYFEKVFTPLTNATTVVTFRADDLQKRPLKLISKVESSVLLSIFVDHDHGWLRGINMSLHHTTHEGGWGWWHSRMLEPYQGFSGSNGMDLKIY